MNQIKFGQRYAETPHALRRTARDGQAMAATATPDDDWPRLGLMIAASMLTGFVVAAIECL